MKEEILSFFKQGIKRLAPEAEVYVFGSRADLGMRGGDIDLLILSGQRIGVRSLQELKWQFWSSFGEQKVDLVNFTFVEDGPFKRIALSTAVKI